MLGRVRNDEVMQDSARAFANLTSNEENHMTVYRHGGLQCLIYLTNVAEDDITKRYAAMGLTIFIFQSRSSCSHCQGRSSGTVPETCTLGQSGLSTYSCTCTVLVLDEWCEQDASGTAGWTHKHASKCEIRRS